MLTKLGMMLGTSSILKKVGRRRKRTMKMEILFSQGRILMVNRFDCELILVDRFFTKSFLNLRKEDLQNQGYY